MLAPAHCGARLLSCPSGRAGGSRAARATSSTWSTSSSSSSSLPSFAYPSNVVELARDWGRWASPEGRGESGWADGAALRDVFTADVRSAQCHAGAELAAAYGVERDSVQDVVTLSNLASGEQAVFNVARHRKPQTFAKGGAKAHDFDPTREGGKRCDFCDPLRFTATDAWGRFETAHVVTASNLFKCAGQHGLILFRRHEPLGHTLGEVGDMFKAFHWWVGEALGAEGQARGEGYFYPMLVWNVLPRAGASQYHGHAQTLLTESAPPAIHRWSVLGQGLGAGLGSDGLARISPDYVERLMRAHRRVGLVREVVSSRLTDGGGEVAQNEDVPLPPAYIWASLTPVQDMELVVYCEDGGGATFLSAFYAALTTLTREMGVLTFNAAAYTLAPVSTSAGATHWSSGPTVARFVQRGDMASGASDYGCLEVFAGTKVARTDPFVLVAALDRALAAPHVMDSVPS